MKDIFDDIYKVIHHYEANRGMTYAEAIGVLVLVVDELAERCRNTELKRNPEEGS